VVGYDHLVTRRRAASRTSWVGAVLVAALVTAGCDGGTATRGTDHYVALGDSFTSGAGLPHTTRDGVFCGQSSLSYPHLVAKALSAELTDVSCGGATTDNGTQPQSQGAGAQPRPPQLDAVTRATDLVTVSLGGNDLSWYLTLMFSCTSAAAADPTGNPCEKQGTSPESDLTALPPQIGARLEDLLTEVHRRAPAARVLLVGYPQLVPAHGTCPELPLATGDYPFVRAQWEAMGAAMREAAAAAGATYVDVLGPSEGHDICAGADAWVNGFEARSGFAAAYHPLASGQAAVAELVEQALQR
jgi:lysophospholipase L1-like esterase